MKKWIAILTCLLLLCLIGTGATRAYATILWAGGEDMDFVCVGSCAATTNSADYNSGYAREAVGLTAVSTSDPPADRLISPTFTAGSTLWLHVYDVAGGGLGGNANQEILGLLSPDGVARILIRLVDSYGTGKLKISTRNSAGTITDLVSTASACWNTNRASIDVYVNYSSSGEASLYCNGTLLADYTGNVTTDSATQLNQFYAAPAQVCGGFCEAMSEFIVATTNTTSMRLVTLVPTANGNTDNWDVGGVSNINEAGLDDTTVNASGTSGQIQEYTVSSLPSTNLSVLDVRENIRAQVGTTGPQHVQAMVRTASTDYTSSNLAPPQSIWGWVGTDWATNPNTSAAWALTDLTAAGFNMGLESAN
jgi:hypothetical protein